MDNLTLNNKIILVLILILGVLSIFAGGKSLFTDIGIETRGNIIPLVLYFNFFVGFIYVWASYLILKKNKFLNKIFLILAVLNSLIFVYLIVHISYGKPYELKTFFAMLFRTSLIWGIKIFYKN